MIDWTYTVRAGLQAFEIMAIAAVGNNLITYVINEMHFSLSKSANVVTNFVGTVFLLALVGGFLSDSYLGSFWTMLIFGFVELSVSYSFIIIIILLSFLSKSFVSFLSKTLYYVTYHQQVQWIASTWIKILFLIEIQVKNICAFAN